MSLAKILSARILGQVSLFTDMRTFTKCDTLSHDAYAEREKDVV